MLLRKMKLPKSRSLKYTRAYLRIIVFEIIKGTQQPLQGHEDVFRDVILEIKLSLQEIQVTARTRAEVLVFEPLEDGHNYITIISFIAQPN